MGWFIHHVNIQAHDVQESAAFYREVLGMEEGAWRFPAGVDLQMGSDRLVLFGTENRGVHIVRPESRFQQRFGLSHNPTIGGHFAVNVPDADAVKKRLKAAGYEVSDAGVYAMAGVRQLYVWDPSYNLVEINAIVDEEGGTPPAAGEAHGKWAEAPGWHLHHVNIEAHDVRASAAFYQELIGIEETEWQTSPDSPISDVTANETLLAPFGSGDNRGLHVVKPQANFAKRNGLDHNPTIGGHFAIQFDDLEAAVRRLDAAGIFYSDAGCYAMAGLRQLYLYDPAMNLVELNGPA